VTQSDDIDLDEIVTHIRASSASSNGLLMISLPLVDILQLRVTTHFNWNPTLLCQRRLIKVG